MSPSPDPASFYRLPVDAPETAREAAARIQAEHRLRRQRELLRPLGALVIAAVVIGAINGKPALGSHGEGLGLAIAVSAFALALALATRSAFVTWPVAAQTAVIAVMGGAGIALVALQPHGATELAAAAAVWLAVIRLPLALGATIAIGVTGGLGLALGLAGASASVIAAAVLLCTLLALVGYFVKQARASQATTELLFAQLEDAREEQLEAAAITERNRIAAELHDVLAHSLSGAAIQLQGARKLAERDGASPDVEAAVDRAAELVRAGLASAREAVSALRGDTTPGVTDLARLIETFRRDTNADVSLRVEGTPCPLHPDSELALYRSAQEGLTNVARYAPGAVTTITLCYAETSVRLVVEDRVEGAPPDNAGLPDVGGGSGLAGLRARVRRSGGDLRAGPTGSGWRVEVEVPA